MLILITDTPVSDCKSTVEEKEKKGCKKDVGEEDEIGN
jgi:hypothetical protein